MKKFIALLMIVATLMTAAAFAKGAYLGTMTVVNCKNWVTLRESASTSADTVTRIPRGENVDAYAYNGRFAECYYNGKHGYVLLSYLADGYARDYQRYEFGDSTEQNADYDNFLGFMQVVNCKNWVTLRASASTKADTVARIPLGACVEAYRYDGKFAECYYNGMHGFVLMNYLADGNTRDYQRYQFGDSTEQNADYDNFLGFKRVANCNSWVTLRASASTNAGTVARIPLGARVEAYRYNEKFAECYYNGMHGFVLNKYLK